MVRVRNVCPPGILCITPTFVLIVVICVGVAMFLYFDIKYGTLFNQQQQQQQQQQQPMQQQQQPIQQQPIHVNVSRGGDDRYTVAPEPTRIWNTGSISTIATQGLPESYQSMGIVTTSNGELLPLYGRRVASRSDRFNYYTRTDTNNPIPLPIQHKRRNCQDDVGCEELFDGENVQISPTHQNGTVSIYRFNGPTYNPNLI